MTSSVLKGNVVILIIILMYFFFQAEDGIRDDLVTGVQTCALPISRIQACAIRPPRRWFGDALCEQCGSVPPGRDRAHTSRRSRPAAPALCRYWRSPFRGGYAARGSAVPADRPAAPGNRSTARPYVPAA